MRALAHDALRLGGVVPEIGILGERVQLIKAGNGLVEVKDASSAEPAISRCPLRLIEFRRA
jgi:hypothetical protein